MASMSIYKSSHTANLNASGVVRPLHDDTALGVAHYANMAKKPWYLKQWRKHRGYTQERLAEMIGTSKGHISDLENRKRPWNEGLLDLLADALSCDPVDILIRDPSDPDGLWSVADQLSPVQRVQLVEIAKTIKRTGTEG